jgi:hypothetical protein
MINSSFKVINLLKIHKYIFNCEISLQQKYDQMLENNSCDYIFWDPNVLSPQRIVHEIYKSPSLVFFYFIG